jgi:hypothetical protein
MGLSDSLLRWLGVPPPPDCAHIGTAFNAIAAAAITVSGINLLLFIIYFLLVLKCLGELAQAKVSENKQDHHDYTDDVEYVVSTHKLSPFGTYCCPL